MRGLDSFNLWSEPSTSFARHCCSRSQLVQPTGLRPTTGSKQQTWCRAFRDSRSGKSPRRRPGCARAEASDGKDSRDTATQTSKDDRIKQTLAGLDALLGVEEDEGRKKDLEAQKASVEEAQSKGQKDVDVTFSKEVLDAISKAEADRLTEGKSDAERKQKQQDLSEHMAEIMENARKMSESTSRNEGSAGIDREMESLFSALRPQTGVSKQHQQQIKEKVFGPTSFYVTEIRPLSALRIINLNSPSASNQDLIQSSILVRGNLRAKREEVFDKVCDNLRREFGDEYTAIMVTDPESEEDDLRGGPRVAFQIAKSAIIQPLEARTWQKVLALVLGGLTLATALQLGLTANISKLPKEVLDFIAQPDAFKDNIPPAVEEYDALPFLLSALPISLSVLGIQLSHEIGHRLAASARKVGCFGAITQLKTMARNRSDLFDVAAAGPAAGVALATALFTAGLIFSKSGTPEDLLPVPGALLNGSFLLGSISRLVLGTAADATTVNVHPFLIAGWCGIVSSALNCLPVGCLDGGRVMMAAFGRNFLGVTSFFTYLGLGLGFLGGGLALPFGIFVLLCQREPEKYLQDTVTQPNEGRRSAAAALIAFAILVLLPMLPGASDLTAGSGGGLSL